MNQGLSPSGRDEVCSVTQQVCSVTQQVCSASQQVCSASNEVSSGSRAFICRMNTTLSEAVTTTFASDDPFFTTEQVTSVAEEIIGDVPVMSLSTINKQTERSLHEPP